MTETRMSRIVRLIVWSTMVLLVAFSTTACRRYPDCKKDKHCLKYIQKGTSVGGETHCVDGTCRECLTDDECDRGEACTRNTCTAIPGYCDEEILCPEPQRCRNNRCGPQCMNDGECAELGQFYYCQGGSCVEGECNSDADCAEGFRCEAHMCRAIPVAAVPCANGQFRTVLFDFDESAIRASERSNLSWNAACFEQRSESATIEGHCDERGTNAYNMALGNRRATAVKNFLRDAGVDQSRMRTVSYGESRPAARGSNESAWSQNRRAEFVWSN